MNDDDVKQLIDRAFPPRAEQLPTEEIWARIEPEARLKPAQRGPRIRPGWWVATAAVAVVATLALFLARPQPGIEPSGASLDLVLNEFERVDGPMRAWLIEHRPRHWKLNAPAVLALDRAIAEARALLEENPDDSELSSRVLMYGNWRADLLAGLAYDKG